MRVQLFVGVQYLVTSAGSRRGKQVSSNWVARDKGSHESTGFDGAQLVAVLPHHSGSALGMIWVAAITALGAVAITAIKLAINSLRTFNILSSIADFFAAISGRDGHVVMRCTRGGSL